MDAKQHGNLKKPDQNTEPAASLPGQKLSWLLDRSIRLPGGITLGLDGLIGLIPGVGDLLGALLSLWIVFLAYRHGASKTVLSRMVLNILIDMAVGAIPVLGDVFDFFWMANDRNIKLLQVETSMEAMDTNADAKSASAISLVLLVLCALAVGCAILFGGMFLVAHFNF